MSEGIKKVKHKPVNTKISLLHNVLEALIFCSHWGHFSTEILFWYSFVEHSQGCAEGGFQVFQETLTEIVSSKQNSGQWCCCWQPKNQHESISLHYYRWEHNLPIPLLLCQIIPQKHYMQDQDDLIEQSVKYPNKSVTINNILCIYLVALVALSHILLWWNAHGPLCMTLYFRLITKHEYSWLSTLITTALDWFASTRLSSVMLTGVSWLIY